MYHITLDGQGYLIDLDRYVRRSFDPFAGKLASGQRSYGDLRGPEQVLRVSDWSGGEGYAEHDPANPSRFREAYGIDGYSEPGALRLGPEVAAAVGNFGVSESAALAVFNNQLVIGTTGGSILRFDGTTLTLIGTVPALGTIRAIEPFMNRCYLAGDGGGQISELSAAWSLTAAKATVAGAAGIQSMQAFYRQAVQFLYLVAYAGGVNGLPTVVWFDGAGLSPKQYDFEQGFGLATAVLENRLYWFVSDLNSRLGVYSIDDSSSGGVYRHHVTQDGLYCWDAAVFDGKVYLACNPNGQIYSWDGTKLERVRLAGVLGAAYPYELRCLATWNQALWVAYQDASGLGLLRFDGTAWSRPVSGLGGDAPRKLAVYASQLYLSTFRTGLGTLWRTTGTYRSSGYVESGLFDAGLPGLTKVARSATVFHAALAAGQGVQLQYRFEATGAWTTLGTSSTVGATTATFAFSGATSWKSVAWRVVLAGPGGASTPVVREVLIRYAVQPSVAREWEFPIILEGTAELPLVRLDGSAEPQSGVQLAAALWASKAQTGPLTFIDLDASSRTVWFEELQEEIAQLSQRKGYQTVGKVRLVEAA